MVSGIEALQSVQFVTRKGKRFAVVDGDDWNTLIEWLETIEDVQVVQDAFRELKAARGSRRRAGWRKWDAVQKELR